MNWTKIWTSFLPQPKTVHITAPGLTVSLCHVTKAAFDIVPNVVRSCPSLYIPRCTTNECLSTNIGMTPFPADASTNTPLDFIFTIELPNSPA